MILVDDEPAMLLAMRMLLSRLDGVKLVSCFQTAAEALAFIDDVEVDMAFLDIELNGDSGLELARRLRAKDANLDIVFTTSHTEFSMQAYDVYPLDYMVKPISRQRLAQTIARADSKRLASVSRGIVAEIERLSVRGIGGLDVVSKKVGEVKWISRKSKEVFAYLLIHRGRPIHKARIIEDIFGHLSIANAESYLSTAAYQLRKVLAEHGFKEVIHCSQEKYRLDLEQIDADFIRWEQELGQLKVIDATNAAAAVELEKAFSGGLFEDTAFEWVIAEQERLSNVYVSFAALLAGWLSDSGQYREALRIAVRLVARNEFDEEANLLLIRLLAAVGDQKALLEHEGRYRQLLYEELGLQPSPRIEQAYAQARCGS
ncbi:response regulator [Paenibacillus thalictri]|uniref:response regulator n=1 Tax=Paenibacillus thalictri TaxID=2527873 RepID=UPI001F0D073F|nr:response regulator [Paenibacillus thalictri]